MSEEQSAQQAVASIDDAIRRALELLSASDAPTEALARFEPPRRRALVFTQDAQMVPLGRVWRLGVFLLGVDGTLFATGHATRAVDPKHPGYQSISAEERRGYRAAAFRGPFTRGETVNFDAELIARDAESLRNADGPLLLRDEGAMVRWRPSAGGDALVPFARYLAERVELLLG